MIRLANKSRWCLCNAHKQSIETRFKGASRKPIRPLMSISCADCGICESKQIKVCRWNANSCVNRSWFSGIYSKYFSACRGTSGIDVDLRRVDIDQCPQRETIGGTAAPLNIFAGTDKCKQGTTEVSLLSGNLFIAVHPVPFLDTMCVSSTISTTWWEWV